MIFLCTIQGSRWGMPRVFHFIVEGTSDENALVNASKLQAVRLLDEVTNIEVERG